jgi:hypothetical protein
MVEEEKVVGNQFICVLRKREDRETSKTTSTHGVIIKRLLKEGDGPDLYIYY